MQKLQVRLWSALFQKSKESEGDVEGWKICVRTEGEKRRILLSCHAGIEGKTERIYYSAGPIILKSVPASWLCMNCRSV